MDFVSTPNPHSGIVGVSDEDEVESRETRPMKRRKKATENRTDSQFSLTQLDRARTLSSEKTEQLDDDGFQIWQDSPPKSAVERLRRDKRRQSMGGQDNTVRRKSSRLSGLKIMRTVPASPKEPTHGHNLRSSVKKEKCIPEDVKILRTPRKLTFTEIPSSQSPLSGKLSTQRSVRFQDVERSPLKERSTNVRQASPTKPSVDSQPTTLKMLQRVHLERVQARKGTMLPTPPIPVGGTPEKRVLSWSAGETKPKRSLKRTNTVQDSQFEQADLALDDGHGEVGNKEPATEDHDEFDHDEGDGDYDDDMGQNTYDPAHSALDRDATRFLHTQMQTQTQGHDLTPHVSNSTCSDEEIVASEDDHDDTIVPTRPASIAAPMKDLFQELGDALRRSVPTPSEQHPDANPAAETEHTNGPPTVPNPDIQEQDPTNDANGLIPSSPPILRPSQVSTVVPTQQTPKTQRFPPRPSSHGLQFNTLPAPNSPSPPRHTHTHDLPSSPLPWPPENNTLSSSPLPLPPWSSPERMRLQALGGNSVAIGREQRSDDAGGLSLLVDFSLPPPPPLSSSSGR